MTNELKKRDCDVKIKLTPSGMQFLHFEMDVMGDRFDFLPASTVGYQFGAFVSALYALFGEGLDLHCEWQKCETLSDEDHAIHTFISKVRWDNEGDVVEIILSRKCRVELGSENDMTEIEIRDWDDDNRLKKYTVKTKDLCYAVAKACTEVLKEYGFYGYRDSTEYDCFELHQLLYIKSVALSNFEARELVYKDEGEARYTSFEKELELLLFDM